VPSLSLIAMLNARHRPGSTSLCLHLIMVSDICLAELSPILESHGAK
jgi:hypothetical protein